MAKECHYTSAELGILAIFCQHVGDANIFLQFQKDRFVSTTPELVPTQNLVLEIVVKLSYRVTVYTKTLAVNDTVP